MLGAFFENKVNFIGKKEDAATRIWVRHGLLSGLARSIWDWRMAYSAQHSNHF